MLAPLHRNRTTGMVGGVCSGLAETFHCDPALIRLVFAFMALMDGAGVLLYLILWLILPREGQAGLGEGAAPLAPALIAAPHARAARTTGIVLIIIGLMFLLQRLNVSLFGWIDGSLLLPIALIGGGVFLAVRRGVRSPAPPAP